MSEETSHRGRRWWVALLGLGGLACAVCCAGPILAVLGVGAGGAAIFGAATETVSLILLGLAGVAGVLAFRRVRRSSGETVLACGDSCAIDGSCGCGPGTSHSMTCTLPGEEFPERLGEFRALHEQSLIRREHEPGRFAWVLRADGGAEQAARSLAEKEQGCCSFFQFDITSDGKEVRWEARAPEAAGPMLDLLYRTSDGIPGVMTTSPVAATRAP